MSAVRFIAWGMFDGVTMPEKEFQALRKGVRAELQRHGLVLEGGTLRDHYRLIKSRERIKRKANGRGMYTRRKVLCSGTLVTCCKRAAELLPQGTADAA